MSNSWKSAAVSPQDVMSHLRSGNRAFIQGASATPTTLLDAMVARKELEDVWLYHLHLAGPCPFVEPAAWPRFHSVSMFAGAHTRKPIEEGRAEFMPIFLSDIPGLFQTGAVPLDAALVQLSPPDSHGNCTLGTSVDATRAAVDNARLVLAEINEQVPRTHGNTVVPLSRVHAFTLTNRPLWEAERAPPGDVENRIATHIAAVVEDGATLQMGIGAIPDAVLSRLHHKNDLGVHTEMFSDGLMALMRQGVITNRCKHVHPGRTVTSFVTGSQRLFEFVNDNLQVEFHGCDRTNDTALIRKNDRVVAVNSAIEIDLSGQVCADSMGARIFSGIGGQMDFIRGAALSKGGKPIIALPSTAAGGKISRVVSQLKPGAGVVTTRGHVHHVATEWGMVNLHGRTLRERADLLISIAHPDFRGGLRQEAAALRHF